MTAVYIVRRTPWRRFSSHRVLSMLSAVSFFIEKYGLLELIRLITEPGNPLDRRSLHQAVTGGNLP